MADITKLTYQQLKDIFTDLNDDGTYEPKKVARIVFTADSFSKPYTEVERTYEFTSDNKVFKYWCGGYSLFARCIDGTDNGVRLERYIDEGVWKVDYCYIVE